MPNTKIRADHDALQTIAQTFQQRSESNAKTHTNLKNKMAVLQGGDWVGKAATKFYKEMESQVLPAVQRLAQALALAAQTTKRISTLMRQTEAEAARLFSENTTSSISSGNVAGLGAMGSSAGGATAQPDRAISASELDSAEAANSQWPSFYPGGLQKDFDYDVEIGGSIDRMLSEFDLQERAIVARSPTLMRQLEELEAAGYTIETNWGEGSWHRASDKKIMLDTKKPFGQVIGSLAHEAGHALYEQDTYHPPTDTMTREEFIALNVHEDLRDEAFAQMNAARVRQEVLDSGGGDIRPFDQDYDAVYQRYTNGQITWDEALNEGAELMGNETTSTTDENYRVYYGRDYEDAWDEFQRKKEGGVE